VKDSGVKDAKMITYLWAEGIKYLEDGLLNIPDDVTIVFTDSGGGYINRIDLAKPGDGVYYHTAMYDSQANQLTEMVPPSRMYENVGAMVKKNATSLFILNTSDLKPVPL